MHTSAVCNDSLLQIVIRQVCLLHADIAVNTHTPMKILNLEDIPAVSDYASLARAVHKDRSTVWRAVRSGALKAHTTPDGKTLFFRSAVLKWLGIPETEEPAKPAVKPVPGAKRRASKMAAAR
jgi:hypothetical protein